MPSSWSVELPPTPRRHGTSTTLGPVSAAGTKQRSTSPDYVQSLARGLAVLKAFSPTAIELSASDVANHTGLARPTARRLLLTLEQLGYVRTIDGRFALTTKSLELGTSYVAALGIWEVARPHLERHVAATGESSSMSQLDGSDIVCIARVGVPKVIAFSVHVGTRFPAAVTAPGKVLLADQPVDRLAEILAIPSRSGTEPSETVSLTRLKSQLVEIRRQGWALVDEELSRGLRAIAAPITDPDGRTIASINTPTHAAETSIERLLDDFLPRLVDTARAISTDWCNRSTAD